MAEHSADTGHFGALLARLRRDRGVTQSQIGELLKLTQSQVSKIEAGQHALRMDDAVRILAALDVSITVEGKPLASTST